jgi:hypothetical protein
VYFLCTMMAYVFSGSKESTGSVVASSAAVVMVAGGEVEVAVAMSTMVQSPKSADLH